GADLRPHEEGHGGRGHGRGHRHLRSGRQGRAQREDALQQGRPQHLRGLPGEGEGGAHDRRRPCRVRERQAHGREGERPVHREEADALRAPARGEGVSLPNGRLESKLVDLKPLYTDGEAIAEANRCLYCQDAPCIAACPTGIDIPTFIRKIGTENVRGSARTILNANLLGYSCARVCPVEVLCAGACVYNAWERTPIAIGRLQRYATEKLMASGAVSTLLPKAAANGQRNACVGSGPA